MKNSFFLYNFFVAVSLFSFPASATTNITNQMMHEEQNQGRVVRVTALSNEPSLNNRIVTLSLDEAMQLNDSSFTVAIYDRFHVNRATHQVLGYYSSQTGPLPQAEEGSHYITSEILYSSTVGALANMPVGSHIDFFARIVMK